MKKPTIASHFIRSKEHPAPVGDTIITSLKVANGLPEIVFAALKKSGLAMLDGVHNLADISYLRQLSAIRRHAIGELDAPHIVQPEEHRKHRKNTYRLMSWTAIAAAGISGYGAVESLQGEEKVTFDALSYGHLGTTFASLTLAGALAWSGRQMQKIGRSSDNLELQKDINDFYTHAKIDLGSSVTAFAGAGVQATGHTMVDHVAGMALAAYQAVRFWPSEANLQRGLDHDH